MKKQDNRTINIAHTSGFSIRNRANLNNEIERNLQAQEYDNDNQKMGGSSSGASAVVNTNDAFVFNVPTRLSNNCICSQLAHD